MSDLDVLIRTVDDTNRYVREVLEDDTTVVRRSEVRILSGELMSLADYRETETLRRLCTPDSVPRRDVSDHAIVDDHDRVGRADGGSDGVETSKGVDGVRDDPG